MSDWINHDGKAPPNLKPGTMVKITMRGMPISAEWTPEPWEFWLPNEDDDSDYWVWPSDSRVHVDIVAYRVVSE